MKVSSTLIDSRPPIGGTPSDYLSPAAAAGADAAIIAALQQRNLDLENELSAVRAGGTGQESQLAREFRRLWDDFNNLFVSSEVGTVFLDRELRIRKFSPALERIFDLKPADLGGPVTRIADQLEGKEEMLMHVTHVLQSGESMESEVLSREGRWFLKRSLPYLNGRSEIDGVVITFTEISANKAMHSRFDLAIESSRLVWWEWDIESGHLSIPSSTWFIVGYEHPQPQSHMWLSLAHPDDVANVKRSLDACLRGDTPDWDCEHRFKTRTGGWLWVANKARVTERGADQRPLRMLGTTQDIDTRKRAEYALARDAALLARVEDSIICTDAQGLITYWNKGAEQLYGWTSVELLGRPLTDRLPPEGHAVFEPLLRGVLEGKTLGGEFEDYRKDGSRVWIDAQAYPMRDDQGHVTGLMGVARDITNRRKEAELHRQLEKQLFQSQKMETLGTLAGGIAHDFNNLLMIMLGHTEIAVEMIPENQAALNVLQNVRKAGTRATELVRRIMAFSRVSEQPLQAVVLGGLVSDALPLLRASLPTTIEIESHLETGNRTVRADPTQLQQVLFNLCVNAGHAMQEKGGQLVIKVTATTIGSPRAAMAGSLNPGRYLCISVADTGIGMTADVMARAFEPFFTTKAMGNGTGLGLSIVHSIVTGHGGAVQMASKPRKGTVVSVFLPEVAGEGVVLQDTNSANSEPKRQSPLHPSSVTPNRRPKVIAVVDDEESISHLTKQALDTHGFKALAFTSGQECLDYIAKHPGEVSLVITDQIMPKITGSELVTRLRAQNIATPAIIVSGVNRPVSAQELQKLNPVSFLAKPFQFAQLVVAMNELLPARK
ncbi:MAG TPA: PAS domain S-box protein [Opitutaceae bacterium]|nr:PAS domain S-box protein [Opitutaceae bacterium]